MNVQKLFKNQVKYSKSAGVAIDIEPTEAVSMLVGLRSFLEPKWDNWKTELHTLHERLGSPLELEVDHPAAGLQEFTARFVRQVLSAEFGGRWSLYAGSCDTGQGPVAHAWCARKGVIVDLAADIHGPNAIVVGRNAGTHEVDQEQTSILRVQSGRNRKRMISWLEDWRAYQEEITPEIR